jgi:hypothetical protein
MYIFWVLLIVAALYFFIIFVVARLVVPFMGFGGLAQPLQIPKEIAQKISELEMTSSGANDYLRASYNFVVSRWHAGRMDTVYYANLAFRNNLQQIWRQPGYGHCNTQNYLLFVLLTGSKFFAPIDVKLKTVFFNFFIHQYLQVRVEGSWLDVDPAGASIRGEPLGAHISLFG